VQNKIHTLSHNSNPLHEKQQKISFKVEVKMLNNFLGFFLNEQKEKEGVT